MQSQTKFSSSSLLQFIAKFHGLIGVFIGPFIITAAVTGALYGFAFATEDWMYRDVLTTATKGPAKTLEEQIFIANSIVKDEGKLLSVRPGATGETTRVLYTGKGLNSSEYRTIFINPETLEVKADLVTYGSSGGMPLRRTIDLLHRDLLLGTWGRWYSELAASWLWVTGITGLILYLRRRKTKLSQSKNSYQQLLNKHTKIGLFCFVGLFLLSITGLTWSELAGENISKLRSAMHWQTPAVNRKILNSKVDYELSVFDQVQDIARKNGIQAGHIEIKPAKENTSWLVSEIERGFPTQVDAVAVDPANMKVISRTAFADFPLMAKLTRWGIDLHMGSLFGLPNQILLIMVSLAIAVLGVTGYVMWFRRKGWRAIASHKSLFHELVNQPILNIVLILSIVVIAGMLAPLIILSFLFFIFIGIFRTKEV